MTGQGHFVGRGDCRKTLCRKGYLRCSYQTTSQHTCLPTTLEHSSNGSVTGMALHRHSLSRTYQARLISSATPVSNSIRDLPRLMSYPRFTRPSEMRAFASPFVTGVSSLTSPDSNSKPKGPTKCVNRPRSGMICAESWLRLTNSLILHLSLPRPALPAALLHLGWALAPWLADKAGRVPATV